MLETKTKLLLRLCLFTFICLMVIECREIHLRPTAPSLPKTRIEERLDLLDNSKMPNQEFCLQMILEPEDIILVLPWWYHYCQDLRRKSKNGLHGNVKFSEVQKYMDRETRAFKKKQMELLQKEQMDKKLMEQKLLREQLIQKKLMQKDETQEKRMQKDETQKKLKQKDEVQKKLMQKYDTQKKLIQKDETQKKPMQKDETQKTKKRRKDRKKIETDLRTNSVGQKKLAP